MMITVIIPVYNGKKYLRNAISSVQEQTYKNIEIIVIDDGSTDGLTIDYITKINSKIVFYSKSNEGLGLTRNFGIHKANGKYIFFLDVDDTLPKNAIELLYTAIKNNDIAIGQSERVFYNNNQIECSRSIWKEKIADRIKNKYILVLDTISTNKLYRKDFLVENNIYFEKGLYEDKLFVLKLLENTKKYTYINKIVYYWRVEHNNNSISSSRSINNLKSRMNIIYDCIEYTKDNKMKQVLIENTIKHDLKIYVNYSYNYNLYDLLRLYNIYFEFITKYKIFIENLNFKKNKEIMYTINNRYHTIYEFLKNSEIKEKKNYTLPIVEFFCKLELLKIKIIKKLNLIKN